MASGTLTSHPDQVAVGERITLSISISDFNNNAIALSADNDPGDASDWRTVKLDANNAATVTLTPANAGSYTFTLQIDGSAATDANGQPITAGPVTVNAPVAPTTTAPPSTTTQAAPSTTTTAPPSTTTQAAPSTTTTAPPSTTTQAAPSTTTTAPPSTTMQAAPSTTTTAPPSTTTQAAPSTTTTAPASTTTGGGDPASTTTAAAASDGPIVDDVTVNIEPDDGADHHAHSIQVATDARLTLTWSTQNATGVEIAPLGSFGPSGSTELPNRDASYSITAVDGSGATSQPYQVEIHTHEPGDVVSPHVDVKSGIATVLSVGAEANGAAVDRAAPGDDVELKVVASADADSVKVDDQEVTLQDSGDGHKRGSLTVKVPADAKSQVAYSCKAIKDGQESEAFTFNLTVDAPASTTTTAPPSTSTTAAPTTTTAAPGSTTTAAPGSLENPTWGAAVYKHGQPIEIGVDAVGVPDGQTVYFVIESEDTPGTWKKLQTAQATTSGGKAKTQIVLQEPEETTPPATPGTAGGAAPVDNDLCGFRFHASLSPIDDGASALPPDTTTQVA